MADTPMKAEDRAKCKLCGEPMPDGEEMFFYHGYSGPCPKPPLPKAAQSWDDTYVAYLRFTESGSIVTCNSDDPKAFKVWREAAILEALREQREADAKLLDDHIKAYDENEGAQRTALQIAAAAIRGSHDR